MCCVIKLCCNKQGTWNCVDIVLNWLHPASLAWQIYSVLSKSFWLGMVHGQSFHATVRMLNWLKLLAFPFNDVLSYNNLRSYMQTTLLQARFKLWETGAILTISFCGHGLQSQTCQILGNTLSIKIVLYLLCDPLTESCTIFTFVQSKMGPIF